MTRMDADQGETGPMEQSFVEGPRPCGLRLAGTRALQTGGIFRGMIAAG